MIAESIAGDEDDFAKAMTRKARALGMSKTVYKNASGLPDSDQVTTARDQATLGRASDTSEARFRPRAGSRTTRRPQSAATLTARTELAWRKATP